MFMHEVIPVDAQAGRRQRHQRQLDRRAPWRRRRRDHLRGREGLHLDGDHAAGQRKSSATSIRVNAVSPGVITTPFHERYSTAEQLKAMQATIPMNRLGTADECAGTFIYLASDAMSGYVTGQVIEVNGGQYMP